MSFRHKLLYPTLAFMGAVVALLAIEASLRLYGDFILHLQRSPSIEKDALTIIALGESTTQGIGPNNYPRQLEDLLRKDCRRPVQVVNLGVAGIYTDSIAQNLEGQLDRYRPRLLVVMMGINDPRQLGEPGQSDWLHELRLFKLVQWIVASLGDGRIGDHVLPGDTPEAILARMRAFRDRNPSNPPLLDNNDYLVKVTALLGGLSSADVMRFHRQVLSIYPAHKAAWNQLGLTYRYLGDLRNAVEAHRKAADLETNPNSVWYRTQLALDYAELKDGKSFMEEARKVTRIPGKRKDTPYYQALDALLQGALKMRDYAGFKVLLRREFSENPHNEMLLGYR
ncbi:MAG: GDSL-type esterase/lipase family protein, partial [Bdellovibrionota bacterium]